eukprot:gene8416-241_t
MFSSSVVKAIGTYLIAFVALGFAIYHMYIRSRFQNYPNFRDNQVVDFLVIGGGSAGTVLASRLTESRFTVLLLEAGETDNDIRIKIPAAFPKLFKTKFDWGYETEVQQNVNKRKMVYPRGKVVGGCSSTNAMIYNRGNSWDYDQFGKENPGWSYEDVLPYFISSEKNKKGTLSPKYHGFNGQLIVEDMRGKHEISEKVLQAMINSGFTPNEDTNGETAEGVGWTQSTTNNGRRWSAADAYLSQAATERQNFLIRTKAQVTRILFEGKRAIGAEFVEDGKIRIIRARKEVILSAGAINTPQILLNSGIGPSNELQKLKIPVIHNLQGVGKNLQDHIFFPVAHVTNLSSLHSEETVSSLISWVKDGKGPLASNIGEVVGFMKSSIAKKQNLPPDLEFGGAPAFFVEHGLKPERNPKGANGVTVGVVLLRPKSSGFVKLKSKNPLDAPVIQPNYFSVQQDLDLLVEGFKKIRDIFQTKPLSDFVLQEVFPGSSVKSEESIRDYIKNELMTLYHPTSTCKMGKSEDKMSVVDSKLKIHGLKNIRIVDASIFPNIISGHTHAPVVMVAEKASDLIKQEHFGSYY